MTDALFAEVPLFAGLSSDKLEALERLSLSRTYERGAVIFRQGDPADGLYLIETGRVKLQLTQQDGEEVIVDLLGEGEYFGEMALIDAEPRSTGVVALQETAIRYLPKADFRHFLSRSNELAQSLLQGMTERLRNANRMIESLATLDVYGRVARTLMQYADQEEGRLVVSEPLTQQDIAHMVGASREMVNRVFQDLVRQGLIRREGRTIVLSGFSAEVA
ncbi:Crp/Fnr family transcriptional regulator [Thiohalorhabdus sp. Cl-TMA]|uniref:Crp/Fnr family transcriptional regulator n=1 Tax=Thiohalorhabdus methylotrophus TaxID=3242694 RepID=A0ABV4TV02_9GAMM